MINEANWPLSLFFFQFPSGVTDTYPSNVQIAIHQFKDGETELLPEEIYRVIETKDEPSEILTKLNSQGKQFDFVVERVADKSEMIALRTEYEKMSREKK